MLPQIEHKDTLNGKFIGGPNLAMINGHEWKAQRKLANPAFSRSMPVNLFGKLTQDMFKMIDALGETVSMSELLNRWTLDAIGKAGFGKERIIVMVLATNSLFQILISTVSAIAIANGIADTARSTMVSRILNFFFFLSLTPLCVGCSPNELSFTKKWTFS